MRDPGAVVPGAYLAQLVGAHARHGGGVGLRVVADRDLRRHAAHGVRAAPVAGMDQQLHVRLEEMPLHGHGRAVRQQEVRAVPEFLDEAEDIVPAPAVEAGGVLAQLVEDLVHLEGGENRLDQHRSLDRAARHAECVLRGDEHLVPQPRFQVALDLRQVEVRSGPGAGQRLVVVGEEQREVEQRTRHRLAVDAHVLLRQVPAARPHDERRGMLAQPVDPAGGLVLESDGAAHGIGEVHLPADDVLPGRRTGILEVRHEAAHRRVQGVDDHLAIDRASDLHAPVGKILGHRGDAPVARTHLRGGVEKLRQRPGIEQRLAAGARGEQLQAAWVETAVQTAEQLQCERRQYLLVARHAGAEDLDLGSRFLPVTNPSVRLDVHGPPSIRGSTTNLTMETSHC